VTGWQSCPAATISVSLIQSKDKKGSNGVRTVSSGMGGASGP
jgi:hypothetical protein